MIALSIDLRDQLTPALLRAQARARPAISRGVKRAAQVLVREWKLALSKGHTPTTLGVITGTLRASIHADMTDDLTAVVGSPMPYAAIHEYGGTIVQFRSTWHKTEIHIPKRPHLAPAWEIAEPIMRSEFQRSVSEAMNG